MYVSDKKIKHAIDLFKQNGGIMRTSEALEAGIHRRTLYKMRDEGILQQLDRGVYKLETSKPLNNPDLAIVVGRIPSAKICLISALDFHELTTQIPHHVHIALERTQRNPKIDYPPLRIYRFSGKSLTEGIEKHTIDGLNVQIYNPAKTIADCFKFRNKIGKDVAIEALHNAIQNQKATIKDILYYADICRVKTIIKPYIETIASE